MPDDKKMRAIANAAFRFVVSIDGQGQAAFTECTLPVVEWEIERLKEGGTNNFIHQLPGQRKPTTVTLKNGVGKSELMDWYLDTMGGNITRKPVTITLLDSEKKTVMVWNINDAFPSKWTGPQLQSDSKTLAIQSLDLACGEVTASYE
ncbi:MAG: phage tail protein [Anaerolineae bacterium]|nr:phage tail protein [Anaerolineae bacterium]